MNLVTTHLITYEQIWSDDLWIENTDHTMVEMTFRQFPQLVWLLDEGYKPTIHKWHNIASQNMHIAYQFRLPESVITFVCLKWPEQIMHIDYDQMITTIENRDDTEENQTTCQAQT